MRAAQGSFNGPNSNRKILKAISPLLHCFLTCSDWFKRHFVVFLSLRGVPLHFHYKKVRLVIYHFSFYDLLQKSQNIKRWIESFRQDFEKIISLI